MDRSQLHPVRAMHLRGARAVHVAQQPAHHFQPALLYAPLRFSTNCACAPLYGRLADVIGRKQALLMAVTFFTAGTTLCALAPTMLSLVTARAVAGMGGGGIAACMSIVLTDLVPNRSRGIYQGIGQLV